MRTGLLILTIVISSIAFADNNSLANQSWVVSKDQQLKNGIWNGKRILKISHLDKSFDEFIDIREIYDLGNNLYMVDGHYMTFDQIKQSRSDIYSLFVDLQKKDLTLKQLQIEIDNLATDRMKLLLSEDRPQDFLMEGEIFQHIDSDKLLVKIVGEDRVVALQLVAGHPFFNFADGEFFAINAVRDGIYKYGNVQGALTTVKLYRLLTPQEQKRLDNEREKIRIEKRKSIEKKISDLTIKTGFLQKDIISLRSKLPDQPDLQNFCFYHYNLGVESDLGEGLIAPDANCKTCNGGGNVNCSFCIGTGKTNTYDEEIDVISMHSKSRTKYKRQLKEAKRQAKIAAIKTAKDIRRGRNPRNSTRRTSGRKTNAIDAKRMLTRSLVENSRERRGTIVCAICSGKGWLGCNKCVLVDMPRYKETAKEVYSKRWSSSKN